MGWLCEYQLVERPFNVSSPMSIRGRLILSWFKIEILCVVWMVLVDGQNVFFGVSLRVSLWRGRGVYFFRRVKLIFCRGVCASKYCHRQLFSVAPLYILTLF